MAAPSQARPPLRFGSFELDLDSGDLRQRGVRLKLQEQPFRILVALLEQPGEIVTREELRQRLWPADTFVDFEHSLNAAIKKLRQALGDDADNPRFIETVPKRGYRFIAPVQATPEAKSVLQLEQPRSGLRAPWSRTTRTIIAASAVIAISALALFFIERGRGPVAKHIHSIAVLPLQNLSGDQEQQYFADGMTDELITELARVNSLQVISRTSVTRFRQTQVSAPQIARELNVDGIVEGSVLRSGTRVRVTVQLIDAVNDRHVWARSYERELSDVIALQADIARAVTDSIAVRLNNPTENAGPHRVVPEAHEALLKGEFFATAFSVPELQKAVGYFKQAIEIDPDYAVAYADLAEAYGWLAGLNAQPQADVMPAARDAALRALQLDPALPKAHHALGWVKYVADWDFSGAEQEFQRAIALSPSDATAHTWYGMFLAQRGRFTESLREFDTARRLDPLSLVTRSLAITPYVLSRRFDDALTAAHQVLTLDPNQPLARWFMLWIDESREDIKAAADDQQAMEVSFGAPPDVAAQHAEHMRRVLSSAGPRGYWRERVKETLKAGGYVDPYNVAQLYARMGSRGEAIRALKAACETRSADLIYWFKLDPAFDEMRDSWRVRAVLRRVQFPM
jgi:TolB-like protein/DNA-binding winged helix-turn-helix (wHTH) protein/Tfp pilus assembly protein PilF